MATPEALLERLFRVTVALSDAMDTDLARRGLTRARATLMAHLHAQGPTIQSALAQTLRVSPRNVTGLVDGLQVSGLVRRSPHPTDGRAALVELTADGARAAAALAHDQQEFARYLFADRAAAELRALAAGLDHTLERLGEPDLETLRQRALQRWPLTPRKVGSSLPRPRRR